MDSLVATKSDIRANVRRLHLFATGNPQERRFHRARIKNGKNFVAYDNRGAWTFSPSKFAGYLDNDLSHADKLRIRDGRVTDAQINRLIGTPLELGDIGYSEIDREFESYCSAHGITPSRHPRARRYWLL